MRVSCVPLEILAGTGQHIQRGSSWPETAAQSSARSHWPYLALADLTAGGGILKPAQAQKFMRLLIKDSMFTTSSISCALVYKRLDRGRFRVPTSTDERAVAIEIEEHELDALLDGIEVSTPDGAPQRRPRKPRTH